jgi:hypothetical protein
MTPTIVRGCPHDEPLANHVPVRSELALPQPFEIRAVGLAPRRSSSEVSPSQDWVHRESEEVCRHALCPHILRLPAGDLAICPAVCGIASKVIVALPIESWGRKSSLWQSSVSPRTWRRCGWHRGTVKDSAILRSTGRSRYWRDAERQRDYRDSGESWALVQLAQRVTNVMRGRSSQFVLLGKLIPWANTRRNGLRRCKLRAVLLPL